MKTVAACLILLAAALPLVPRARAEPLSPPGRIIVTAAPLGKFGFGTGTGGPLWRSTIGHLVILSVQPGGPAEAAGLRRGDEILAVDGLSVPGRPRAEVFAALRAKDARQLVTFRVAPQKGGGPARDVRVRTVEKR